MCAKGNKEGIGGVAGGGDYDTFGSKDQDLADVATHRALQRYLDENGYNIKLGRGTRAVDVDVLKASVQSMAEVIDANPFMRDMPIELKTSTARSYAAQAGLQYSGGSLKYDLTLGAVMKRGTLDSIKRAMNSEEGFHPENQTTASAIAA